MLQDTYLLIMGIGLVTLSVVVVVISKLIAAKIAIIAERIDQVIASDWFMTPEVHFDQGKWNRIETNLETFTEQMETRMVQAELIASGETDLDFEHQSVQDRLGKSLMRIQNSINALEQEVAERPATLETPTDLPEYNLTGSFMHIKEQYEQKIRLVQEKIVWYEAILDAIPFEIHVFNKEMKWVYLNQRMENVLIMKNISKNRESAYGMTCNSCGSGVCNTVNCGVKRLVGQGLHNVTFEAHGKYFDLNTVQVKK